MKRATVSLTAPRKNAANTRIIPSPKILHQQQSTDSRQTTDSNTRATRGKILLHKQKNLQGEKRQKNNSVVDDTLWDEPSALVHTNDANGQTLCRSPTSYTTAKRFWTKTTKTTVCHREGGHIQAGEAVLSRRGRVAYVIPVAKRTAFLAKAERERQRAKTRR